MRSSSSHTPMNASRTLASIYYLGSGHSPSTNDLSLDIHDLDDGRVANAVERHDAVAPCAILGLLGVLDGGGQDLVCGVAVSGARGAFCQQRQQAAGDKCLPGRCLAWPRNDTRVRNAM